MADEVTYEYQRVDELMARVVDLEVQLRRFAGRVDQLIRQRQGLIRILADIRDNGGCTSRHWRFIDRILATSREWDDEDSGRH